MGFKLRRFKFTGEPKTTGTSNIYKWPHDHEFPFDVEDPRAAKQWLLEWRHPKTGELLPREDEFGHPWCYCLFRYGGIPALFDIFPGYDKNGGTFPKWYYGRLDIRTCHDNYNQPLVIDPEIREKDINTSAYERDWQPTLYGG